jgi:hypothetical protein
VHAQARTSPSKPRCSHQLRTCTRRSILTCLPLRRKRPTFNEAIYLSLHMHSAHASSRRRSGRGDAPAQTTPSYPNPHKNWPNKHLPSDISMRYSTYAVIYSSDNLCFSSYLKVTCSQNSPLPSTTLEHKLRQSMHQEQRSDHSCSRT